MNARRCLAAIVISLAATPAAAREAGPPESSPSPFDVRVLPGFEAVRPGETLPVAAVFDIPPGHKLYERSISVDPAPGTLARVVGERRPPAARKFDKTLGEVVAVYEGRAVFNLRVELSAAEAPGGRPADRIDLPFTVKLQGCTDQTCFLPETRRVVLHLPVRPEGTSPVRSNEDLFAAGPATAAPEPGYAGMSFFLAILAAFGSGLLISFTPCVYPLIPITAAVIGAAPSGQRDGAGRAGGGGWKKGLGLSLVYVLGLSITYSILGAAVAKAGGAFGTVSEHWITALAIGVIFGALSWSLFGVYELALPSGWQARLRTKREGGAAGVFVMGLLSGLVATPCIAAPIAGILLFISTTGNVLLGAAMLFALAWGMSLFLILAGTFSSFSLGGAAGGRWTGAVKTGLGVAVVAASLYFLRPVLPLWIFTAWAAAPLAAFGLWRGVFAGRDLFMTRAKYALRAAGITALVFGVYSGLGALVRAGMPAPGLVYAYPARIVPSGSLIDFREDHAAALEEARAAGAPVMVDIMSDSCPNCLKLERDVFADPGVAREAERFVAVKLNVSRLSREEIRLFKSRYRFQGTPTVAFIDTSGDVRYDLAVIGSGIGPEKFVSRMRQVK